MADKEKSDAETNGTGMTEVNPVETPELNGAAGGGTPEPERKNMNLKMILDIPVDIHVELGSTTLPIKEVLKLGTGSIVELDRMAGKPADIVVNGEMIGEGEVVVVNDNFGIRITKLVKPEERIESL